MIASQDVPRVLIVEDDLIIAEYFKLVVETLGYSVCGIATTADQAVEMARGETPALIFMDVRLEGDKDGVDAANEIHKRQPVPTVYVTGSKEPETIARIQTNHPTDILIKPVLLDRFEEVLNQYCPRP